MSYTLLAPSVLTQYTKLTSNSATTVLTASQPVTVVSVECTEIGGSTPNLTIEVRDPIGPTSHYKKFQQAMTAKQTVTYSEPFVVPNGWSLRVTSSNASGQVDVTVTYLPPDASRHR